jgi:Kef-type K+ transport system membrane component KefB
MLGVFGACYKLAVFMALSIQAFRYAAEPFFFTHAADKRSPQLFSKVMRIYILIACWIWFAISAN